MNNQFLTKTIERMSILLFVAACLLSSVTAQAANDEARGIGFTYNNIIPDNQIAEGNYFDLLVTPSKKQTLVTEIKNDSNEKITVNIVVSDAKTTESGLLDFGPSELKNTKGLKVKLTDLLKVPESVTLKKGESKQVKMELSVPKEAFAGLILGGIELQKATKGSTTADKIKIKNEYAYVYSISLRESKDAESKVDDALSGNKSSFVNSGGEYQAKASFNNDTPKIVRGMAVESYVTVNDSEKVLGEMTVSDFKMAPFSQIAVPIVMKDAKVGSYVTHTKVKIGEQEWEWESSFEITEDNLTDKNRDLAGEDKKFNNRLLIVMALVVVISTGIIYFMIRPKRK